MDVRFFDVRLHAQITRSTHVNSRLCDARVRGWWRARVVSAELRSSIYMLYELCVGKPIWHGSIPFATDTAKG